MQIMAQLDEPLLRVELLNYAPLMQVFLIFILMLFSCGPINPEPETDDDGNEIRKPEPFDRPLQIVGFEPDSDLIHPESDILVRFDRYLSDEAFTDFSAIFLASGGLRATGRARLLVAERAILLKTSSPMVNGFDYQVVIDPDQIFSETGAPLGDFGTPLYRVDASVEVFSVAIPEPDWEDVSRIFDQKCNGCHSDPQWQLPELTHAGLVGVKSGQVDRFLVRANDPTDSYLLQKVLPDYANRRFTVQPPPWSDGAPLTSEEIAAIEFWIADGAPGPTE